MKDWEHDAWHGVRNTIARYTWCGDYGDVEGFVGCFTKEAVLTIKYGEVFEGHDGLRRLASGQESSVPPDPSRPKVPLHHHVSSVRIEVESPELARSWAYFVTLGRRSADHWGRYADEFVRVGDLWLFRNRRVSIDGSTPTSYMFPDGPPTAPF